MIRVFDLKTRKGLQLNDKEALEKMTIEGDRYLPVRDDDYIVIKENGEGEKVKGRDLMASLGDGGKLMDPDRYAIRKELEAENSKGGQFIKGFLSEALTLGLVDSLVAPNNPHAQMVEKERKELFGGAESWGRAAGNIIPFALGGVGGLLSQGVKAGAKKAVGKAFTGAGKLPSAQVLKVATKSGDKLASLGAKYGLTGKKTQAMLKGAGVGGAFAGAEAVISGTKAGIQQHRVNQQKDFPGGVEAGRKMDSALGAGLHASKETFTSTAVLMGAMGLGGKTLGLGVKAIGAGAGMAKKSAGKAAQNLRASFLGISKEKDYKQVKKAFEALGEKSPDEVKKIVSGVITQKPKPLRIETSRETQGSFKGVLDDIPASVSAVRGKKFNESELLKEVSDYISEIGIAPKSRVQALKLIAARRDFWGIELGKKRKDFDLAIIKENFPGVWLPKRFFGDLRKNLTTEVEKFTNLKPFNDYLKKVEKFISTKGDLKFSDIHQIARGFAEKSRYPLGEKATKVHDAFRRAYYVTSNYETHLMDNIQNHLMKLKSDFLGTKYQKTLSQMYAAKKEFEKSNVIHDILKKKVIKEKERGLWSGLNMYQGRDIFIAASGIAGGGVVAGPVGAIVGGVGLSLGANIWRKTGHRMLSMANMIDNTNRLTQLIKTPKGLKSIINNTSEAYKKMDKQFSSVYKMNTKKLSAFLFGMQVNNINDLNRQVIYRDPVERIVHGQEDLYGMVDLYGGRSPASQFQNQSMQLKESVMQILPKPLSFNEKGEGIYDDNDIKKFYSTVDQGLTTPGFIKAFREKSLTVEGLEFFKRNYPAFFAEFLQTVQQMDQTSPAVEHFKNLTSTSYDQAHVMYYFMDMEQKNREQQDTMRGGPKRKFNIEKVQGRLYG